VSNVGFIGGRGVTAVFPTMTMHDHEQMRETASDHHHHQQHHQNAKAARKHHHHQQQQQHTTHSHHTHGGVTCNGNPAVTRGARRPIGEHVMPPPRAVKTF
jgi:hypothetical protein